MEKCSDEIDMLIEDFKTFNEAVNIATAAKEFAELAHKNQVRKFSGLPYFVHPESVANLVMKHTKDLTLTAAAYLHDTLEDTPTTYNELKEKFSKKIADLVYELTSADKDEQQRVGGKAKYLTAKMEKMSSDALTIKLCDRLDNVSDKGAPANFKERYYSETKYILDNLTRSLNGIQQEIIKLIKQKIGVD